MGRWAQVLIECTWRHLSSSQPQPPSLKPQPGEMLPVVYSTATDVSHTLQRSNVVVCSSIFMPPPNVVRPEAYCFCSVRPCVRPETLLTQYLENLHQTLHCRTEMNTSQFGVKRSKVKVTVEYHMLETSLQSGVSGGI